MKENEFECALCHGVYERNPEWTDADMEAEALEIYGRHIEEDDRVLICDDCHILVMGDLGAAAIIQQMKLIDSEKDKTK